MRLPIISTIALPAGRPLSGRTDRRAGQLVFVAFVLLILAHHCFVFLGFYGMDDINYARYAARLASGESLTIRTTDHFELRWLAIYITAFFYRLFGINDFSSAAFGTITVVLTGWLILRLLRNAPWRVVFFALLLFFLDYHVLFATHRIWPDTAVMLLLLAACYGYLQAFAGKRSIHYPLLFSVSLFLAMLAKETVILFVPLLLILLLRDGIARRLRGFWLSAIGLSLLLCLGYAGLFKYVTGDWWYRYTVLQWNMTATECDFANLPPANTFRRIGYQLWQAFLLNGDMIVLLMGACGLLYRRRLLPDAQQRELALIFGILLLSANFMSISFTAYVPLCHDPRHFLFLLPFAAILGARLLPAYFSDPAKFVMLPVLFGGATCILFIGKGGEMKYVYLLISLVLFAPLLVSSTRIRQPYLLLAPFLLAACLLVRPAYDLHRNRFYYFEDHKKLVQTVFADTRTPATVYTANELMAELSEYFLGFQTGAVQFRWLERPTQDSLAPASSIVYFLVNRETEAGAAGMADSLHRAGSQVLSVVRQEGPIVLYLVEDGGTEWLRRSHSDR